MRRAAQPRARRSRQGLLRAPAALVERHERAGRSRLGAGRCAAGERILPRSRPGRRKSGPPARTLGPPLPRKPINTATQPTCSGKRSKSTPTTSRPASSMARLLSDHSTATPAPSWPGHRKEQRARPRAGHALHRSAPALRPHGPRRRQARLPRRSPSSAPRPARRGPEATAARSIRIARRARPAPRRRESEPMDRTLARLQPTLRRRLRNTRALRNDAPALSRSDAPGCASRGNGARPLVRACRARREPAAPRRSRGSTQGAREAPTQAIPSAPPP